jgi:flavin-binding protein dodecin
VSNNVYKKLELTGSSPTSIEEAVENAISKCSRTVSDLRWFEVTETRGVIEEGKISAWQVTVKIGFTLKD